MMRPLWQIFPRLRLRLYLTVAVAGLASVGHAAGGPLRSRASVVPAPVSVTPAENFDGIDGQWNSFYVRVGTPAQYMRVFVSTASQQTWVIQPPGCTYLINPDDIKTCASQRGMLFNHHDSSTWIPRGLWSLWIERNLGYEGNADYGFDNVGLGAPGEEGPMVKNVTVGATAGLDFYLGIFGVNPKPTNFTAIDELTPSWMSKLREQNEIPSLSFSYTAGMPYRDGTGVLASLTLGGYDDTRFNSNNVTFTLASNNERDITVSINSISVSDGVRGGSQLLPSPIYAYIDSTVPQIWLPREACDAFQDAFSLKYDEDSELYLIDDNVHEKLVAQNPQITFTLGTQATSDETAEIVFPYAAFSHIAKPPYQNLTEDTRYFPLRRADNDTQFTLGRAFLQEAYLTVDWERENFSVSQATWKYGVGPHIVPIRSPEDKTATGSDSFGGPSPGVIAGAIVGGVVLLAGFGFLVLYLRRRRRRQGGDEVNPGKSPSPDNSSISRAHRSQDNVIQKAELDANQILRHEIAGDEGTPKPEDYPLWSNGTLLMPVSPSDPAVSPGTPPTAIIEVDGTSHEIFEMPGDLPPEADGRQMNEKEAMLHRAKVYNGLDLEEPQDSTVRRSVDDTEHAATGIAGRHRRRPAPIDVSDVVEVNSRTVPRGTSGGNGHISPLNTGDMERRTSPMSTTMGSNESPRRRFSFEE